VDRGGPVGPFAVVLLVVLAGCGGTLVGTGDAPAGRTITPAPVPTDTPEVVPLPPGVSTDGVTDARRLETAHLGTLSNATFVERARTTVSFENGSVAIEETYVGRHGTNATATVLRRNGTAVYGVPARSLVEVDIWENESFGARRFVTTDGRVEFEAFDDPVIVYAKPRPGYGIALRGAETTLESRRVANGSVEYVILARTVEIQGPWYFQGSFMDVREAGHARLVVSSAGTIRRFVVEFPIRLRDRNATLRHTYTVVFGDVTAPRPPWFDEALAGRTSGSLSVVGRVDPVGPGPHGPLPVPTTIHPPAGT
jgi:hypothetical protein